MRSIVVTVRWCQGEQEQATEITLRDGESRASITGQKGQGVSHGSTKHLPGTAVNKSGKQLLPSDRVVLGALRRRITHGEKVTDPVRNGELAAECEISRRQVQICLKRLTQRRLIKRLVDEEDAGAHRGHRYRIC